MYSDNTTRWVFMMAVFSLSWRGGRKRREVNGGRGKKHNGKETERWKGRNLQERNGKEFVGERGEGKGIERCGMTHM